MGFLTLLAGGASAVGGLVWSRISGGNKELREALESLGHQLKAQDERLESLEKAAKEKVRRILKLEQRSAIMIRAIESRDVTITEFYHKIVSLEKQLGYKDLTPFPHHTPVPGDEI